MANARIEPIKIIVLGDAQTGKTQLVNRYYQGEFSSAYNPTYASDFKSKDVVTDDGGILKLQSWDIADPAGLGSAFCRGADAVLILFDVNSQNSFSNLKEYKEIILKNNLLDAPIILVGTKANESDHEKDRQVTQESVRQKVQELGCEAYCETSARNGENVAAPFMKAAERVVAKRREKEKIEIKRQEKENIEKKAKPIIDGITKDLLLYQKHLEEKKIKVLEQCFLKSIEMMSRKYESIDKQIKNQMIKDVKNLAKDRSKTSKEQSDRFCEACYTQLQSKIKPNVSLDQFKNNTLKNFEVDHAIKKFFIGEVSDILENEKSNLINLINKLSLESLTFDQKFSLVCQNVYDGLKVVANFEKISLPEFQENALRNFRTEAALYLDKEDLDSKIATTAELIEIATKEGVHASDKLSSLKGYLDTNAPKLQQLEKRRGDNLFWKAIDAIKTFFKYEKSTMGVTGAATVARVSESVHGYFKKPGEKKEKERKEETLKTTKTSQNPS